MFSNDTNTKMTSSNRYCIPIFSTHGALLFAMLPVVAFLLTETKKNSSSFMRVPHTLLYQPHLDIHHVL
jgi:hypothetical protein